ncbi:MAG: class I SAM-dependent methyltransferase [Acidimicrobiales bacterium]
MLTVDYDQLGVTAGSRLLDLGCGAGRHAFGALSRGVDVVAFDLDLASLKDASALMGALHDQDELPAGTAGQPVNGSALLLPFPEASFDHVIAAEVLEHIPADRTALGELVRVLRPGGTIAVTVPRWYPELINWALSDDYHMVEGGHVRIYRRGTIEGRMRDAGLRITGHHHAHSLHSPYWWLKCLVGVNDDQHPAVKAYHRFLVWDITDRPAVTRIADRVLNPIMGKSVVVYGTKR